MTTLYIRYILEVDPPPNRKEVVMSKFVPQKNARINHAIMFAVVSHGNQVRKGNEHIPYVFHPIDVANEIIYYSGLPIEELEKSALVGILHDTVEDTAVTLDNIRDQFGEDIARGVGAMSKDETLCSDGSISKEAVLRENIERLKKEALWVQVAKLADRISNLKSFPAFWSRQKIERYLNESIIIADELGNASKGLQARLLTRVAEARMMLSIMG